MLLYGNQITSIDPDIFNGLTSLRHLNLNDNQLTLIELGVFNGLTNLQELYLNSNHVESIELGAFNELTNLRNLNLDNNHLTSIVSGVFNGLDNLQFLDLANNRLTSLPDITYLTSLLDANGLNIAYNYIDYNLLDQNVLDFIDAKQAPRYGDWRSTQTMPFVSCAATDISPIECEALVSLYTTTNGS